MSFGTMFTILFTWYFQSLGISLGVFPTALIAIPFAIIITILFTLVTDKLVFSYYRTKKSPPVMLAMVSIGTMFVTQAIVRIIIGPFDRRFFDGERFILKANEFKEMMGLNEGLTIKSTQAITLVVTIIVTIIPKGMAIKAVGNIPRPIPNDWKYHVNKIVNIVPKDIRSPAVK